MNKLDALVTLVTKALTAFRRRWHRTINTLGILTVIIGACIIWSPLMIIFGWAIIFSAVALMIWVAIALAVDEL
jgi:hypothetical protein